MSCDFIDVLFSQKRIISMLTQILRELIYQLFRDSRRSCMHHRTSYMMSCDFNDVLLKVYHEHFDANADSARVS